MKKIASAGALAIAAWYLYGSYAQAQIDNMPDQITSTIEDALIAIDPSTYDSANIDPVTMATNARAFLDMIAYSEGADYDTLFGGGKFDSYADHPRQVFSFTNSKGEALRTSAAGRYQFLARTWDYLKQKLALPDFGPASQDAAAIELIRERGAFHDVAAGRCQSAIAKCAPIWASLPGAGYNQPERKIASLLNAYQQSGGTIA
jgi:lysozyme